MALFALVTSLPLHIGLTTTLSRNQSERDICQRITDAAIQGPNGITVAGYRGRHINNKYVNIVRETQ